jgi:uncharacterized peroxidase-related enzyme
VSHIKVPQGAHGITGPMMAYPETARFLNQLADHLLTRETPNFSKGDREMVAAYVSWLNQCVFCSECHGAVADYHLKSPGLARLVWNNVDKAPISQRLKALLVVAAKVQKDARSVGKSDVDAAVALGASEADVHDTVLIAAAFCMFNRYVDGLGTSAPPRESLAYAAMGERLAKNGYARPT